MKKIRSGVRRYDHLLEGLQLVKNSSDAAKGEVLDARCAALFLPGITLVPV
jgi:hypothetical protein